VWRVERKIEEKTSCLKFFATDLCYQPPNVPTPVIALSAGVVSLGDASDASTWWTRRLTRGFELDLEPSHVQVTADESQKEHEGTYWVANAEGRLQSRSRVLDVCAITSQDLQKEEASAKLLQQWVRGKSFKKAETRALWRSVSTQLITQNLYGDRPKQFHQLQMDGLIDPGQKLRLMQTYQQGVSEQELSMHVSEEIKKNMSRIREQIRRDQERKYMEQLEHALDDHPSTSVWTPALPTSTTLKLRLLGEELTPARGEKLEQYARLRVEASRTAGLAPVKDLIEQIFSDAIGRRGIEDFHWRHIILSGASGTGKGTGAKLLADSLRIVRAESEDASSHEFKEEDPVEISFQPRLSSRFGDRSLLAKLGGTLPPVGTTLVGTIVQVNNRRAEANIRLPSGEAGLCSLNELKPASMSEVFNYDDFKPAPAGRGIASDTVYFSRIRENSNPLSHPPLIAILLSHALTLSRSHTFTLSRSHALFASLPHYLTLSPVHSFTVSLSHSPTLSLPFQFQHCV
jgi:hypothetical protein